MDQLSLVREKLLSVLMIWFKVQQDAHFVYLSFKDILQ